MPTPITSSDQCSWLSLKEAAVKMGYTVPGLRRRINAGLIPPIYIWRPNSRRQDWRSDNQIKLRREYVEFPPVAEELAADVERKIRLELTQLVNLLQTGAQVSL